MGIGSNVLSGTTLNSSVLGGGASASKSFVLIDRTAGTNIGNMTVSGGLAAAFDGTTDQADGSSARFNDVDGWVGKTLAAARVFGKALVYGTNASGFESGPNGVNNDTLEIYGKSGTAPSAYNDGTLLATLTFTHNTPDALYPAGRELDSTDLVSSWDHLWVHVHSGNGGQVTWCAELQLYAWE